MDRAPTLEEVLSMADQLPLADKVRLIEKLAPLISRDLQNPAPGNRTSLRGLWRGVVISEEDIQEARQEMWTGFPRGDI